MSKPHPAFDPVIANILAREYGVANAAQWVARWRAGQRITDVMRRYILEAAAKARKIQRPNPPMLVLGNPEGGRYVVKCGRCYGEIHRTDDMGESARGGTCKTCTMLLGWLKGDLSKANIAAVAKWAARSIPGVGGVRFWRERLRAAAGYAAAPGPEPQALTDRAAKNPPMLVLGNPWTPTEWPLYQRRKGVYWLTVNAAGDYIPFNSRRAAGEYAAKRGATVRYVPLAKKNHGENPGYCEWGDHNAKKVSRCDSCGTVYCKSCAPRPDEGGFDCPVQDCDNYPLPMGNPATPSATRAAALSVAQRRATGELAKVARLGVTGASGEVLRRLSHEHKQGGQWYRDVLKMIRGEGGIKFAGGIEEELRTRLPARMLSRKRGMPADALAQMLADRGIIADASQDALIDFVEKALQETKPVKPDHRLVRKEARKLVDAKAKNVAAELVATTAEKCTLAGGRVANGRLRWIVRSGGIAGRTVHVEGPFESHEFPSPAGIVGEYGRVERAEAAAAKYAKKYGFALLPTRTRNPEKPMPGHGIFTVPIPRQDYPHKMGTQPPLRGKLLKGVRHKSGMHSVYRIKDANGRIHKLFALTWVMPIARYFGESVEGGYSDIIARVDKHIGEQVTLDDSMWHIRTGNPQQLCLLCKAPTPGCRCPGSCACPPCRSTNPDLFGHEGDAAYSQGELGGPTIPVGPTCKECGRGLVETPSGFIACPMGHGKLMPPHSATRGQSFMGARPNPIVIVDPRKRKPCDLHAEAEECAAAPADCRYSGCDGCDDQALEEPAYHDDTKSFLCRACRKQFDAEMRWDDAEGAWVPRQGNPKRKPYGVIVADQTLKSRHKTEGQAMKVVARTPRARVECMACLGDKTPHVHRRVNAPNRAKNPGGIPSHIWNDPRFQAELKAYRARHGSGPVVIQRVRVPKGFPKFLSAWGKSPRVLYDAPAHSTKGKRYHVFGKRGRGQPYLVSSVEGGRKFLSFVSGTFRADGRWIYD